MINYAICIPARYHSTRLPHKPLQQIAGRALILRVLDRLLGLNHPLRVMTDHSEIEDLIEKEKITNQLFHNIVYVHRVDEDVPTGSDRIYLGVQKYAHNWQELNQIKAEKGKETTQFILNVQGDEPMSDLNDLQNLIKLMKDHPSLSLGTLVRSRNYPGNQLGLEQFHSANTVKVLFDQKTGSCYSFSRSPVPYPRNSQAMTHWYQHVGVYMYKIDSLAKFCQHPQGIIEKIESLEQWRFLEMGLNIGAIEAQGSWQGVDTAEDVIKVSKFFK